MSASASPLQTGTDAREFEIVEGIMEEFGHDDDNVVARACILVLAAIVAAHTADAVRARAMARAMGNDIAVRAQIMREA